MKKYMTLSLTQLEVLKKFFFPNPWPGLICFAHCMRSNRDMRDHESLFTCASFHTFFIKNHGNFKKFSGQGVEKNSDDAKRVLFQKSIEWHAARGILLTESGLWDLQHHESEKALYTKRKLANQDQ